MNTRENTAAVAWLNARLSLDILTIGRQHFVDDIVSCVLLTAISNANTSYLDARPDISQRHIAFGSVTDDMRRPVPVSSLARSLGIARETARGKAHELISLGLVSASEAGLVVRSDALLSKPSVMASEACMAATEAFIEGLADLGVLGLDKTWRMTGSIQEIGWGASRLVMANMLRNVAHFGTLTDELGLLSAYIFLSVVQETGAHLTLDGQTVPRFRNGPESGNFGPVKGAAISAKLGMPQETVRRHLLRLVGTERLRVDATGYSVHITPDRIPLWHQYQSHSLINTRQMIWKLQAAGVIVTD